MSGNGNIIITRGPAPRILGAAAGVERLRGVDAASAGIGRLGELREAFHARGRFDFLAVGPRESARDEYGALDARSISRSEIWVPDVGAFVLLPDEPALRTRMIALLEPKWQDGFRNTIMNQGGNDLLDKYLAGSSYTAAWYMGLISSSGYSAISTNDTAAQINGTGNAWKEAGGTNNPVYSQATRPAPSWGAASGKSKASNANIVYSVTSSGTAKGGFLTSSSTKDSASLILFSAGLFTQGDRVVGSGDTINGGYTLSI